MATSRSTPRLRLTLLLLAAVVALLAVSERPTAPGIAGLWLQLAGLACMATAALGRIWTSLFIAGRKDGELVRRGPYAVLRHPLYALSLLAMLGVGLTSRSVVVGVVLLAASVTIHLAAARTEDRFLRGAHGAQFERFASEVPAFRPRWSAWEVPAVLEIRPRILWKAFLDAGALLALWVLLVAADGLQRAGITPTWLELP